MTAPRFYLRTMWATDERSDGLLRIRWMPWRSATSAPGKSSYIQSDEPAYVARLSSNPEQNTDELRYTYTSLTTPASEYVINMATGVRQLLKTQEVLGGFEKTNYATERSWTVARDGTKVSVSLVLRKDTPRNGTAPLYQYAYGSYGASSDPVFRPDVISLLDRGFIYAIAQSLSRHVGHHGSARLPSAVLRARQVGRQTARYQDRHESAPLQSQYGSGPRRQIRPTCAPARDR
jgi:protease II